MNKQKLIIKLKRARIPDYLYNLDEVGRDDERLCLKKINDKWNVYYCERGVMTTNILFDSEDEACEFIYNRLRK